MGMAMDGASHHDSLGAVLGFEGSVKGAVRGTWVNLPAGLMTKAAGQTLHKSFTPTSDHGETAVHAGEQGGSMTELPDAREPPRQE